MKAKEIISSGIAHNAIAAGTIVKGEIKAEQDFRIDGKLEGDIECAGKIIVGPQAEILGNIKCTNADLMGRIQGNVYIEETVSLKASVIYNGEIVTKYLEIEPGAVFNGSCKMLN